MLGDAVAEFRCGPLKKRSRVFEKVLMQDGRFDWIRDYARNYIVIKKGQFDDMAMVPTLIARQEEVKMVRAKNRFDPDYNSKQSAGYRDYQIILKTKDGWLVEVQVIPEEMLETQLKEKLGHKDYTEFRVILEAANRVAVRRSTETSERGFGETDSNRSSGIYGFAGGTDSIPKLSETFGFDEADEVVDATFMVLLAVVKFRRLGRRGRQKEERSMRSVDFKLNGTTPAKVQLAKAIAAENKRIAVLEAVLASGSGSAYGGGVGVAAGGVAAAAAAASGVGGGFGREESARGFGREESVRGFGKEESEESARGFGREESARGFGREESARGFGREETTALLMTGKPLFTEDE
eukprot:gene17481-33470_t